MFENLKPIYRALKYSWLYQQAKYQTFSPALDDPAQTPISFVVGCGRSGTTILGKVLAQHPQVKYYFEPYHLWAALDQRTDVLDLYQGENAQLILQSKEVTKQQKSVFPRLFKAPNGKHLIEKTPLNAFRLGYLQSLAPQAKFIHIVRDGIDVSNSIGRIATNSPYKIAGKPELNQWWGVAEKKWKILQAEGAEAGYWPAELSELKTQQQRGAYEWLSSLKAVGAWKETLGDNLLEISYDHLVAEPERTLTQLCQFLTLDAPKTWLTASCSTIHPQTKTASTALQLPRAMAQAFNHYQQQYQFSQRATSIALEVR